MSKFRVILPKEIETRNLHQYLLAAVSPRPIAFASTLDECGNANLAPFSFFNCFSSNPPILVFSSNRRVVDNTTKDTLANIQKTGEVVINVVSHDIVRQMAIASIQFDTGVNEFTKSGLTPEPSQYIKPYRVLESPVHMECKVDDIITLGDQGGAGHLIICRVICMHINEAVIDKNNRIDPHKLDIMGRMGRAYYVRASGDAIETIVQAVTQVSIGYDQLPQSIKNSEILTGNDFGILAGALLIPLESDLKFARSQDERIKGILSSSSPIHDLHKYIKELIEEGHYDKARTLAFIS